MFVFYGGDEESFHYFIFGTAISLKEYLDGYSGIPQTHNDELS